MLLDVGGGIPSETSHAVKRMKGVREVCVSPGSRDPGDGPDDSVLTFVVSR